MTTFFLFLAATVTLAWDPNSDSDLAGYKLHIGIQSIIAGNPPVQVIDVGNVTQYRIRGLDFGTTYYFTATAYNTARLESAHSNEVVYTPWPPPQNEILVQAFQNMSFDDDPSDTASPRGWSAWWPEGWATPGRSRTGSGGGSRTGARCLIHSSSEDFKVYTFQRRNDLPLGKYRAEAWARSSGRQASCGMTIKTGGRDVWQPIPASADWQRVIATFDIAHGFIEVGFWSDAKSGQSLEVDDVAIYYMLLEKLKNDTG